MFDHPIQHQAVCMALLWLGLKYFLPKSWWPWWIALIGGILAGWGLWMWERNPYPVTKVLTVLFEDEQYAMLLRIGLAYFWAFATAVVPAVAVLTFVWTSLMAVLKWISR